MEHNAAQNETVIRGQGELHLRIILEKLKDQFHVELDTKLPQIAYKETITVKAEGHHKHKNKLAVPGSLVKSICELNRCPMAEGLNL